LSKGAPPAAAGDDGERCLKHNFRAMHGHGYCADHAKTLEPVGEFAILPFEFKKKTCKIRRTDVRRR
jgi:hypothetical protein